MLTVTLQVKEIIFDIQNKTYLTGRSREAEAAKGFEAASYMQASDDVENSYQLRRSLNNAFADLKTTLAEYLTEKTTSTDNLVKDAIDKDGAINLELEMPNNFNPAAADNIGSALHQYIVNRAIADWFTITNKGDANDYTTLATEALGTAKRALYKRRRPDRPTFS